MVDINTWVAIGSLFVAIGSLFVAIGSLYITLRQIRAANNSSKIQEKVLNDSRSALQAMITIAQEQRTIALDQKKALELSVKNSTDQLAILNEDLQEKIRIRSLRPKLDILASFISEPQDKMIKAENMNYFQIIKLPMFPTDNFNLDSLNQPVILSDANFPVIKKLSYIPDEYSMNSYIASLVTLAFPIEGAHYNITDTHLRIVNFDLIIQNTGEANAFTVKYNLSCPKPDIQIENSKEVVYELKIFSRTGESIKHTAKIKIPDTVNDFTLTLNLAYEGGVERNIPIVLKII